jgi:hypothetical protein
MADKEPTEDDILALNNVIVERDGVGIIDCKDSYMLTFKRATLERLLKQTEGHEKFIMLVKKPDFTKTGN